MAGGADRRRLPDPIGVFTADSRTAGLGKSVGQRAHSGAGHGIRYRIRHVGGLQPRRFICMGERPPSSARGNGGMVAAWNPPLDGPDHGGAPAAAEQTEFDVVLTGFGDKKLDVVKGATKSEPQLLRDFTSSYSLRLKHNLC